MPIKYDAPWGKRHWASLRPVTRLGFCRRQLGIQPVGNASAAGFVCLLTRCRLHGCRMRPRW
jgi:hypothetical protein